jgi:hypothetical protein
VGIQDFDRLIEQVATFGPGAADEHQVLRSDPGAVTAFQTALVTPRPFDQVENIEQAAITMWSDVLTAPVGDRQTLADCADFFSGIGFLYKYKTYGTKIALPFGYSIFDLKPREGFSFQIHTEPKLEAFHVLSSDEDSFIFVSTVEEWNRAGKEWAEQLAVEHPPDPLPAFAVHPRPGDVTTIAETNVVHTVIGCVLEEYASCSVDAVVRLLDQNHRADVPLPDEHEPVAALLGRCDQGLPARRLDRHPEGWSANDFGTDENIIETSEQVIGYRRVIDDVPHRLPESRTHVSSIVCLSGSVLVSFDGVQRSVVAGDVAIVPPCMDLTCVAAAGPATIAVHQVFTDLVGTQWTR